MYKSSLVYGKHYFADLNDYYFLQFGWKGIRYFAFLNKSDQQAQIHKKFSNDLNGFSAGILKESRNNSLYFTIDSHDMLSRRNHFYSISKNPSKAQSERESSRRYCMRVDSVFGSIYETDNPIIGIYELK